MAISSITTNFIIKGDKQVENCLNDYEASENSPVPKSKPIGRQVTDIDEIRAIMSKRKDKPELFIAI